MTKKRRVILEGPEPFGHSNAAGVADKDVMEYEGLKMMLMTAMAEMHVTPEEYAAFLADGKSKSERMDRLRAMAADCRFDGNGCGHVAGEVVQPMPDAGCKSLRLKVQMKDVSKPPMWREIVIPADFNFSQLHHAIQAVAGLENCHLWQFQHQAYNPDLQIGIPADDGTGFGLDEWTHDADATPVTGFLAKKGDKLEYVYDFGDDWIFTVSVLEVIDRRGDVAECTKWKCDFQPIEDCGGIWAYQQLRDAFTALKTLTSKQKKELVETFGFENFSQLSAWVDDSLMDIEYVNERLAEIPESGRLDD